MTGTPPCTPGPWVAGEKGLEDIVYDSRGARVASVDCWFSDKLDNAQGIANAKLIAAAPDMHAALSAVHAWLGRWAVHAGRCEGGVRCTCGLLAITTEAEIALIKAQGVTDPLQAVSASEPTQGER